MKKYISYLVLIFLSLQLITSCKKDFLETNSSVNVQTNAVFADLTAAQTALDGIYRNMYEYLPTDLGYAAYDNGSTLHADFGQKAYDIVSDLMGNDMVVNKQGYGWFNSDYQYTARTSTADQRRPHNIWRYYYILINNSNAILDNIDKVPGDADTRNAIKGQALAIRAHSYFYLINFFQQTYKGNENKPGVPLYTSVPALPSGAKGRGTVQQVYNQIVADLVGADTLLVNYSQDDLSHINQQVANGIMARVALQMEDYANAAKYADKAINGSVGYPLLLATDYTTGFNSVTNSEWMWGMTINADQSTAYASFFSHMDAGANDYAQLGGQKKITKELYDHIGPNDVRQTVFVAPGAGTANTPDYCQTKFTFSDASGFLGDYLFMRESEMYLIKAEALARTSDEPNAITTLNALVQQRDPSYTTADALSGTALINEILWQRRIELWGEGFSFFDIKRLKTGLNRAQGAGNHGSPSFDPKIYTFSDGDPRLCLLIPQKEFDTNPKFTSADQNP